MVASAFLDLINPVNPPTFIFAQLLFEREEPKQNACCFGWWLIGGRAVMSGCVCWESFHELYLMVILGFVKSNLEFQRCWWHWWSVAVKWNGMAVREAELQRGLSWAWWNETPLRCSRGPSTLTSWDNYWERFRSFPLCSKFCFSL